MDYEALAKKYGGSVAETPPPAKTDYEALAKKYGGRVGDAIPGARTGEPDNSAAQWTAVAARAAAPYAAAMGAGAAGGAVVGGPVGAGLGAAAAPIALGVGDIGTGLYNVVATPFGARRVPLPSETIQGLAERVGIGRAAQTPEQQVFEATVQGALGGGLGARAASALAPALTSPVARGVATTMGQAPILQTAAGGAGAAAPAAASVYGNVDNPLVLMGAGLMGGSVPAFVRGGGDLARRGFNLGLNRLADIADPKAAAYMQAVEGRGPEVINALRQSAVSPVPGYERTAMQAATEAGAPGFQSLGQQAAKLRAASAFERGEEQRGALQKQMRRVGGTDEELAAMKAEREAITSPMYKRAYQVRVQVDEELGDMLMRPDMRKAVDLARRAAENKGQTFGQVDPDGTETFTGAELHRIKKALDDLKRGAESPGTDTGRSLGRSIGEMQDEFLGWVGKRIPEYDAARGSFENQSRLISQVEAGRFLEQSLFPALEGQPMQPASFARAQRAPPKEMETKLAELTPVQRQQIGEVTAELARDLQAQRMASQGRGVAPNIESLASDTAGERVNLLNRFATIANTIMRRLEGAVDKKLAMEIARELMDPETAARAIERAAAQQQSWQSWRQTPKGGAAPIFTQGQIQNVLAGQRPVDEQNRLRAQLMH